MLCYLIILTTFSAHAQKADEDAIKKVVQEETSSFFHKDYDKWADTWAKDSATFVMRADPTGSSELAGWNALSTNYKQSMQGMSTMDEESIQPYLNKTDWHFYINGNMATVTFKEGNKLLSWETRTLVKQNGSWKLLNMTIIGDYSFTGVINNLRAFTGKWQIDDNSFMMEPNDSTSLKSAAFEFKETPNGFEQWSNVTYLSKNQTYVAPAECEYFIPDYNQNEVNYMDIQRSNIGQTYTTSGRVTSADANSFTVTGMYGDKPTAMQYEYTVTLKDGKWHQVAKQYDRTGKLTSTITFEMHRI